jgi:hypothetical protein
MENSSVISSAKSTAPASAPARTGLAINYLFIGSSKMLPLAERGINNRCTHRFMDYASGKSWVK